MSQKPINQLVLMADEHSKKILGCYGNRLVQTPNLDRLAARGTRFTAAYTPSPICVPARASFATGKYCHTTHHWDNSTPYFGEPSSWGHALQRKNRRVGSIGKLHYRSAKDDTGFDFQKNPMHVVKGIGDLLGAVRDQIPLPTRVKNRSMAEKIGPGETGYINYDRDIASRAAKWLQERGREGEEAQPWTLFVSMVTPHFPLIAPPEFYEIYAESGIMPKKGVDQDEHEWLRLFRECACYDNFDTEKTRIALASYYALTSFVDAEMGKVLDALDEAGLTGSTRVIYTSDHGDNCGERGLWGKSVMFEESVGVPFLMAGPDVPAGHVCNTPINLIDVYPTLLKGAGLEDIPADRPGASLVDIANAPDDAGRVAFSEYHAAAAPTGAFMLRKGRWKLIYYAGYRPALYNLEADPEELKDLGTDPAHAAICAELETELRKICDPDAVDRTAKADQAALIERHGGRAAVVAQGGFGATPPPGETPEYRAGK